MDILTLARELREAADLVVADKDGRSLLLVEIYADPTFEAEHLSQLRGHQRKFDFPFAMFVNSAQIWLFGPDHSEPPVAQFPTVETLRPCDPYFDSRKSLSDDFLIHLIWLWLFSFTSIHQLERPSEICCLRRIGLADRLLGGEVMTEGMLFKSAIGSEHFV